MALRPVESSWKRAARNVASGVAMLGIATLGSAARAQSPTVEGISQAECWQILWGSSWIVGGYIKDSHKKMDIRFTGGLAKLIAPTAAAPFYTESIHKAILDGSIPDLVESKKPAAMKWKQDNIPLVTCNGPKIIPTPDGEEAIASLSIRRWLVAGENPIRLANKGVFFRRPEAVVGMDVR
jgi:hypothetical protein